MWRLNKNSLLSFQAVLVWSKRYLCFWWSGDRFEFWETLYIWNYNSKIRNSLQIWALENAAYLHTFERAYLVSFLPSTTYSTHYSHFPSRFSVIRVWKHQFGSINSIWLALEGIGQPTNQAWAWSRGSTLHVCCKASKGRRTVRCGLGSGFRLFSRTSS